MSVTTDPLAWVARAEEDLAGTVWALQAAEPLLHLACFHAQQCAEKYLKALLVLRRGFAPEIPELVVLSVLCEQAGILVGVSEDDLGALSSYSARVRYPGGEARTLEEAQASAQIARAVRRFARQVLGLPDTDPPQGT